jgi:MFS family permease
VTTTRPAALPPAERTVGQLVAESVRFYGERFRRCLGIGVAPAALAVVTAHVSRTLGLVLAPTLYGALLSASFVYASTLVLDVRPPRARLTKAWLAGWAVFAPVPFLVVAFILPSLAWLAAFGLAVPLLVAEPLGVREAFRRAWQLARADFVHALGSLATLAIVVFLTQTVLVFLLRGGGGAALSTALFLANVVISPLLFIGAVFLYLDQSARMSIR